VQSTIENLIRLSRPSAAKIIQKNKTRRILAADAMFKFNPPRFSTHIFCTNPRRWQAHSPNVSSPASFPSTGFRPADFPKRAEPFQGNLTAWLMASISTVEPPEKLAA
jgi:hypothetical protein